MGWEICGGRQPGEGTRVLAHGDGESVAEGEHGAANERAAEGKRRVESGDEYLFVTYYSN